MPALLLIMTLFLSFAAQAQSKPFTNTKIKILTQKEGTFISAPLKKHAKEFSKLTGAEIKVITVPFGRLHSKILSSLRSKTSPITAIVFAPQWLTDFVDKSILADLTTRIQQDRNIQWQDIAHFYRNFSARYKGRLYTVPLDGDFHMAYYRSDILSQFNLSPPRTWKEYLKIAARLNGKDLNGDGIPDYGSCIAKKKNDQAYWMFISIAAPFLQTLGTSQGTFFNLKDMTPLVKNQAFAEALKIYKQTSTYGPNEIEYGTKAIRDLFIAGRCALAIDWGDIGTMAQLETSKVKNKVGTILTPGTSHVLDRTTGRLVKCNPKICPYAKEGINYAPYAAFGGWAGAIIASSPQQEQDLAYKFLSFVSSPPQSNIDVTLGMTGFNPYRISQLREHNLWLKSGMSKKSMHSYLGAIEQSLNNSNMVMDLRIPRSKKYLAEVLDKYLHRFLIGKDNASQTMKYIEKAWNRITDEADKKKQLEAYKASIGAQ